MPDLKDMTGPQLVEEYNRMAAVVGAPPVKKFENKVKGLMRVIELSKKMPAQPDASAEKKVSRKKASGKIKFLVKENPKRAGTDGHVFFGTMADGMTVADYLDRHSDDRKRASLWLRNFVKDGSVEVVDA